MRWLGLLSLLFLGACGAAQGTVSLALDLGGFLVPSEVDSVVLDVRTLDNERVVEVLSLPENGSTPVVELVRGEIFVGEIEISLELRKGFEVVAAAETLTLSISDDARVERTVTFAAL